MHWAGDQDWARLLPRSSMSPATSLGHTRARQAWSAHSYSNSITIRISKPGHGRQNQAHPQSLMTHNVSYSTVGQNVLCVCSPKLVPAQFQIAVWSEYAARSSAMDTAACRMYPLKAHLLKLSDQHAFCLCTDNCTGRICIERHLMPNAGKPVNSFCQPWRAGASVPSWIAM